MDKLSTIQKRNKLNNVYVADEKGCGGAYHKYVVCEYDSSGLPLDEIVEINFQHGPRFEPGSITGILDTDLLEIVRHRLQCFQEGAYATRENDMALLLIEEALLWMNKRVEDRLERNVLGTNKV